MALCGGGSSNTTQNTNTNTTSGAPDWYKNSLQDIGSRANTQSQVPYQPYNGPRVAGLTDDTQNAFNLTRGNVGNWQPNLNNASNLALGAANNAQNGGVPNGNQNLALGFQQPATLGSWNQLDQAGRASYTDPYNQDVTQRAVQETVRQDDINRQGRDASAVGAGSFGGYRQLLNEGEANRNLQQTIGDMNLRGNSQAYTNAQSAFNSDQDVRLRNQQTQLAGQQNLLQGQNTAIQGQQANTQGYNTALQGAQTLGGLGQLQGTLGATDAASLGAIGTQQQQQNQNNLNVGYNDFLEQRGYPQGQLGWYSQMLTGIPSNTFGQTSTTTGSQTAPPPSTIGQLAGAGLAAYGAGRSFGWFNKGGPVQRYAKGGVISLGDFTDRRREKFTASQEPLAGAPIRIAHMRNNFAEGGPISLGELQQRRVSALANADPREAAFMGQLMQQQQGSPRRFAEGGGIEDMDVSNLSIPELEAAHRRALQRGPLGSVAAQNISMELGRRNTSRLSDPSYNPQTPASPLGDVAAQAQADTPPPLFQGTGRRIPPWSVRPQRPVPDENQYSSVGSIVNPYQPSQFRRDVGDTANSIVGGVSRTLGGMQDWSRQHTPGRYNPDGTLRSQNLPDPTYFTGTADEYQALQREMRENTRVPSNYGRDTGTPTTPTPQGPFDAVPVEPARFTDTRSSDPSAMDMPADTRSGPDPNSVFDLGNPLQPTQPVATVPPPRRSFGGGGGRGAGPLSAAAPPADVASAQEQQHATGASQTAKDLAKGLAGNADNAGRIGNAALYAGLAMMQAAARPGATALGSLGAGGMEAVQQMQRDRQQDTNEAYRRDQGENMRAQRQLQEQTLEWQRQHGGEQLASEERRAADANRTHLQAAQLSAGAAGAGEVATERWIDRHMEASRDPSLTPEQRQSHIDAVQLRYPGLYNAQQRIGAQQNTEADRQQGRADALAERTRANQEREDTARAGQLERLYQTALTANQGDANVALTSLERAHPGFTADFRRLVLRQTPNAASAAADPLGIRR